MQTIGAPKPPYPLQHSWISVYNFWLPQNRVGPLSPWIQPTLTQNTIVFIRCWESAVGKLLSGMWKHCFLSMYGWICRCETTDRRGQLYLLKKTPSKSGLTQSKPALLKRGPYTFSDWGYDNWNNWTHCELHLGQVHLLPCLHMHTFQNQGTEASES